MGADTVGKQELSSRLVKRADLVVVDNLGKKKIND